MNATQLRIFRFSIFLVGIDRVFITFKCKIIYWKIQRAPIGVITHSAHAAEVRNFISGREQREFVGEFRAEVCENQFSDKNYVWLLKDKHLWAMFVRLIQKMSDRPSNFTVEPISAGKFLKKQQHKGSSKVISNVNKKSNRESRDDCGDSGPIRRGCVVTGAKASFPELLCSQRRRLRPPSTWISC